MSCSAPVNIRETNQICKGECSYQYNYNNTSSAIITNNGTYLDIKVDGNNNIKFNGFKVGVNDVRLYQPSLHLFDGKQAAAELVISHTGYNHTILSCIPIVLGNGKGKTNNFFSQIIPHISPTTSKEGSTKDSVNVSNWSLNDVVPVGTFYFYVGKYPYEPCNGKVSAIVFDLSVAAKINASDLKILQSLLIPVKYSPDQHLASVANKEPILMVNKASSGGGGSSGPNSKNDDYFIFDQCETIDGMDDEDKKPEKRPDISTWVTMILLLLGGFIVFALIYSLVRATQVSGTTRGTRSDGGAM